MGNLKFTVTHEDAESVARCGTIETPHGTIETPVFMPVGTKATVKGMFPEQLHDIGAQICLANTYHLYLQPGADLIAEFGGLHKFMNWNKPILTDSGGFQVFSLGAGIAQGLGKLTNWFPGESKPVDKKYKPAKPLMKIDDEGVSFRSHIDQSKHRFTPESSIEIQQKLGADIILCFDECTSYTHGKEYTKNSMLRTHAWAERCIAAHTTKQALFGITQGGFHKDLREESTNFIASQKHFDGICIGGSMGKTKANMHEVLEWTHPLLPKNKPRHLLGIAGFDDLLECVERGMDMFDCVSPTRNARAGMVYILPESGGTQKNKWRIQIKNAPFRYDKQPIDPNCQCYVCQNYSRAYIHHLFRAHELLAYSLTSYHNLWVLHRFTDSIREAIKNDEYGDLKKKWLT